MNKTSVVTAKSRVDSALSMMQQYSTRQNLSWKPLLVLGVPFKVLLKYLQIVLTKIQDAYQHFLKRSIKKTEQL